MAVSSETLGYDADVATAFANAVYTVPASTVGIVNWIRLDNKHTSEITASLKIYPLGVSGNAVWLLKDRPIRANSAVHFRGVRTMQATDELHIIESSAVGSVMDALVTGIEHDAAGSNASRAFLQSVSTSYTTLYTAGSSNGTINDLAVINKSGGNVVLNGQWIRGATTIQIIDDVTLEPDELYEYVGTIQMTSGDIIKLKSDTATALDAVASIVV